MNQQQALFEYLLRMADDRLILGHRISEWCGHGPILEEDIALSNIALDLIGNAANLLEYAAEVEAKGRDQDDLAYLRDEREYRNIKMVELPKGDFGFTIARQFLFSAWSYLHLKALQESTDQTLKGLAQKAFKETQYHLRHAREWMLRLGDGTEESHRRVQQSLNELWRFTGELFSQDEVDKTLMNAGIIPKMENLRSGWNSLVAEVLEEATLEKPDEQQYMVSGGRQGLHTEHLGHLLADMQYLQRSYPEAEW